ncbi:MAG: TlpA disulfide reductase family protein, partial [Candidatus Thiodiazotropha sp.]
LRHVGFPVSPRDYRGLTASAFSLPWRSADEEPGAADKVLKEIPVKFPILYDAKNQVSQSYQVEAMPSTFMIDRDGKVRHLHKGYLPGYENDYQSQIRDLLRE